MKMNKIDSFKDIKIKEWKKLSHKEKIDSLIVSHKIKDDPVSQKMIEIISKEESEADAFYIMMLESKESQLKIEKDKLEDKKVIENQRLDGYRFLYNKLTHEEKIEFHLRPYLNQPKSSQDYVRKLLQDESHCDERFEKSLDANRKYTNDSKIQTNQNV